MKIHFSFVFPVSEFIADPPNTGSYQVANLTDLTIVGTGFKHCTPLPGNAEQCYDYELSEILFEGKNILQLLPALDAKESIHDACMHHIEHLFNGQASDFEPPMIGSGRAKVIQLPLRLKANNG